MIAEVMHYYSYDYEKVMGLDMGLLLHIYKCMSILKARDRLMSMQTISYPKMDKNSRRTVHKDEYKRAFPNYFDDLQEPVKTTEIHKFLNKGRRK